MLTDFFIEILMSNIKYAATFCGEKPAAAQDDYLPDRRELAVIAVERSRMPMVVTDPRQPHNPIILANQAFMDLTGYAADDFIGRNCRFLQGPDTRRSDVKKLSAALDRGDDHIEVELLNYRKDGTAFINSLMISAVRSEDGDLLYYFASQQDVTAERRAQELEASERRLLMEVDHRTMNALALIQSIVRLSRAENVLGLSRSINGRVGSLARTHRLLAERKWRSATLADLIKTQIRPMVGADRIMFGGDDTELRPHLVQPLGLVIHELQANAQEHGALTAEGGTVDISWSTEDRMLTLYWHEKIVAPIKRSIVEGFGLQIVRGVVEQIFGQVKVQAKNGSLEVKVAIPDAIA